MNYLNTVGDWIVARLREPTTWMGLGAVAAAAMNGHADPQTIIVGVAGAFGIVMREKAS